MRRGKKENIPSLRSEMGMPDSQVLLQGQNCVKIYPCRRLLQYSDTRICAKVGQKILRICGTQLRVRIFCAKTLEVCGKIDGVTWKGEGEA